MPKLKKKIVLSPAEADKPRLKLNLRLFYGENIAMGPGKAALLEAIVSTGSISAAGRSMDMSYRRAWSLVDEMNRCFKSPLVEAAKGGAHGGGAHLTEFGQEVLKRYRTMEGSAKQVASAYVNLFDGLMADHPPVPAE
jgi:molybdate transport system regulatory protein